MKSNRIIVAALLTLALPVSACGQEGTPGAGPDEESAFEPTIAKDVDVAGSPTFEAMKTRGHVVVGALDSLPGVGFYDAAADSRSGYEIDLARLIAGELGFDPDKVEFVTVPGEARETSLARGDVDYVVSGFTITDERKKRVGFAGPYNVVHQMLMVRSDDDSINGMESLKGKKVCSTTGSTTIDLIRSKKYTENKNIVGLQNIGQCVDQLRNGGVDAVTTDDVILKGFASQTPDELKVVGDEIGDDPLGVGVPLKDKALRSKINDILEDSMEDGTWQTIYDRNLGKSGAKAVSPPTIDRY